jgi:hypothetical protein
MQKSFLVMPAFRATRYVTLHIEIGPSPNNGRSLNTHVVQQLPHVRTQKNLRGLVSLTHYQMLGWKKLLFWIFHIGDQPSNFSVQY